MGKRDSRNIRNLKSRVNSQLRVASKSSSKRERIHSQEKKLAKRHSQASGKHAEATRALRAADRSRNAELAIIKAMHIRIKSLASIRSDDMGESKITVDLSDVSKALTQVDMLLERKHPQLNQLLAVLNKLAHQIKNEGRRERATLARLKSERDSLKRNHSKKVAQRKAATKTSRRDASRLNSLRRTLIRAQQAFRRAHGRRNKERKIIKTLIKIMNRFRRARALATTDLETEVTWRKGNLKAIKKFISRLHAYLRKQDKSQRRRLGAARSHLKKAKKSESSRRRVMKKELKQYRAHSNAYNRARGQWKRAQKTASHVNRRNKRELALVRRMYKLVNKMKRNRKYRAAALIEEGAGARLRLRKLSDVVRLLSSGRFRKKHARRVVSFLKKLDKKLKREISNANRRVRSSRNTMNKRDKSKNARHRIYKRAQRHFNSAHNLRKRREREVRNENSVWKRDSRIRKKESAALSAASKYLRKL